MAEGSGGTEQSRGGRYAMHAEIGSGGMATVHLGRLVGARGFARTVAIKVLHAGYAKNKEFVERFLDEARLVGRIHHPNVMPTLDVVSEGDELRIVMEYVAGESLDQLSSKVAASGERIPLRIAVAIVAGILHGLHAAHEAKNEFGEPLGIVHLDVSPHNILVGTDGTSRLLDFGVARARSDKAETVTAGKPAYLAPEQVRGAEVSPRTDVFAASIVLWELVTGQSLFAADNHAATMQRVLGAVVPAASDKVDGVPARLDELLKVGLRRDPAQRFATARDMALELEQAVAPALPSEVGSWVASVAEETLIQRASKVQQMESMSVAPRPPSAPPPGRLPGLVAPRAMYDELAAVNLPSDALEEDETGSTLRPPGGVDAVPSRAPDGSVRWNARSPPATRRSAVGDASGGAAARGAVIPGAARKASPPEARGRRVLFLVLGAVVVLGGLVALALREMFLPGYIRSTAIARAAARGVTLTVDSAALSSDGVRLTGLTATLVGVPQATATIATAEVRSIWTSPARVVLGKTEVKVDGSGRAVFAAVAAWSAAHRGKGKPDHDGVGGQIDVPAAHLVWTHASGDDQVSRIEASGIQGGIGSPTALALGDDIHFLASAVVVESRLGTFGPWAASVDATMKELRARLAFDPAVPDGPNALLVDDALGHTAFDVSVPRVATTSLGIPRTAAGSDLRFPEQVEVALHYERVNQDQATASLRGALYGLRIPELGSAVDARISGEASGPVPGSLVVKNGLATLGPLRAVVTGTITTVGLDVAANLAWKAEPIACATLVGLPPPRAAVTDLAHKAVGGDLGDLGELARDFGAIGQAAGVVKVSGTFGASGTVAFAIDDLARTKVAKVTKNSCGLSLFQGPSR